MHCYNCGYELSEHDFCTACGADVSLFKRIIRVSNRFYNEGLEKASVRDLSGAVRSLRQSLKFNKNHIEARNLLGLVYFEMGEVAAALSEWVISKNLKPEKNIADDYINRVQSNGSRLSTINQTIRKYNQAYHYCVQGSKDLAAIQLKKVLSMNPRFVRAHQLLALLYIDSEQWDRAKRELDKTLKIDHNNTMSLRYLKEVELMLNPEDSILTNYKSKKDDFIRYQSDNEVIIQPVNVKEPKSGSLATLFNIGIGMVIGLTAMYFLVVPAAVSDAKKEAQKTITEIGNQMDAKTSRVQELESQLETEKQSNEKLSKELAGYVGEGGTVQVMDNLLSATIVYLSTENLEETAVHLENVAASINIDQTSEAFRNLYHTLLTKIGPELSGKYFQDAYTKYKNNEFSNAIEGFQKAFYYDETKVDALYFMAQSYRRSGDSENAITTYQQVIELFPDTERAVKSKQYITDLTVDVANE